MNACERCKPKHGISCQNKNFLGIFFEWCEISLDGRVVLRTDERVDACPILTGTTTEEITVNQLLKTIAQAQTSIDFSKIGPGNY